MTVTLAGTNTLEHVQHYQGLDSDVRPTGNDVAVGSTFYVLDLDVTDVYDGFTWTRRRNWEKAAVEAIGEPREDMSRLREAIEILAAQL